MVETVFTYRYSATQSARDQGMLQAVEEVSSLEHELLRQRVDTTDRLQELLDEIVADRSDEISWMSVIDANGRAQASSSRSPTQFFPPDRIDAALDHGESTSVVRDTTQGQILIALLPIKPPLQTTTGPEAPRNWRLLEIALYLRGPQGVLHPLNRDLLVTAVASIALLASMIVFSFRLKAYVRGRALESQLQLARTVQQRLLPESTGGGDIEFAGQCVPADEVGGDFYDVFRTQEGEIALVLADVSGKGLPAALRMGVVHGAIRALSRARNDGSVAPMAATLNELLRENTSREFVTLFLGFYNPKTHDLQYVNAGHLPPLLVASNSGEVRRLESGGPVLGLLQKALYQDERIQLDGEETLIAYSDGLLEATSSDGEEFGESHLLPVVHSSIGKPAHDVLRRIMGEAVKFVEGGEFHDDLTIFVVKLARELPGVDKKT
jgi:serine phosphatase RsbU (regulator of sigma subunit)